MHSPLEGIVMRPISWILIGLLFVAWVGCRDKTGESVLGGNAVAVQDDGTAESNASARESDSGTRPAEVKNGPASQERLTPAKMLDVSYIPARCIMAVIIHPADILNGGLLASLPQAEMMAGIANKFGLEPNQIEQVIVLFDSESITPQASIPSIILRLTEGTDAASTIEKLIESGDTTSQTHNGFVIHTQSVMNQSVTGSGQLLILSTEDRLIEMLDSKDVSSALINKLKQVDAKRQMSVAFCLETVRDVVDGLIDEAGSKLPFAPLTTMLQAGKMVDSGIIYLDISTDTLLEIQLTARDSDAGVQLLVALEGGMSLVKGLYDGLKAQMLANTPLQLRESLGPITDQLVQGLEVKGNGTLVTVTVKKPTGLEQLVAAAAKETSAAATTNERLNDFRQIILAFHNFHATYRSFPPIEVGEHFDENGEPHLSWRVYLLPYIEQAPLFDQFHLDEPWDSDHNKVLIDQMPVVYKTTDNPGKTTIMGFVNDKDSRPHSGMSHFPGKSVAGFHEFTDGTANTVLLVEAAPEAAVPWTQPTDLLYDPEKPLPKLGRPDEDFVIAAFVDGSCRKLSKEIAEATWRALITRNGMETFDRAEIQ
jgi:hypothetical protein